MGTTLQDTMDRANPNTLADSMRTIKLGQVVRQNIVHTLRRENPDAAGTDPSDLAGLDSLVRPDDGKAMTVLRGYARASGGGPLGELAVIPPNLPPGPGQVSVAPGGNIVCNAGDAYTDVDVEYIPARGDVVELTASVAVGVLTLPAALVARGVVLLEEADALVGAAVGRKVVLPPGVGPAPGQASLDVPKTAVGFNAGDAVTQARVKLLVTAEFDLDHQLEVNSSLI